MRPAEDPESGSPDPSRWAKGHRLKARWVCLAFLAAEAAFFLPMLWGWYPVFIHLFHPHFTGVLYQRSLPPSLNRIQSYDPTGVMMDFPDHFYTFSRIRHGQFPWWNPDIGCGRAWIGNAEVHPFSPLLLPLLIHPSPWFYSLQFVLGSLLCLWGGLRFFRLLGVDDRLAVLGALLWTFNSFTAIWLPTSLVWAYWWMPWLFEGILAATAGGSWWGWIRAGAALALMLLCGHPETGFWLAQFAVFFIVAVWLGHRKCGPGLVRIAAGCTLMAALALLLSAAQWGPILEVLRDATWYKSKGIPAEFELPSLLHFFSQPLKAIFLPPSLCGAALLALRNRKWWATAGFGAMLAYCLCLGTPVFFESLLGRTVRMGGMIPAIHGAELGCLPLAALVVLGLDALLKEGEAGPTSFLRWSALILSGALWAWSSAMLFPWSGGRWIPALWLGLGVAVLGGLLQVGQARTRQRLVIVFTILSAAFPLAATQFLYPDFGDSTLPAWQSFLGQPAPASGQPPERFWAQSSPRNHVPFLLPNLNLLSGACDVRGSAVLNPPGSDLFSSCWTPGGHFYDICHSLEGATPELLRFLNVDRVVLESDEPSTYFKVLPLGALPRAFLVSTVEFRPTEKACLDKFQALLGEGALDHAAVVFGESIAEGSSASDGVPAHEDKVSWREYKPERISLRVQASRSSLLVVTDTANSLWKATLDGHPVPILRTDVMFRGVRVNAGVHTVEMSYETRGMWIFILPSLAGWMALAIFALCSLCHPRRWRALIR